MVFKQGTQTKTTKKNLTMEQEKNVQKVTVSNGPTKASASLLTRAKAGDLGTFTTGAPVAVRRYGRDEAGKLTFIFFETERGGEDVFMSRFECLADAWGATVHTIEIRK